MVSVFACGRQLERAAPATGSLTPTDFAQPVHRIGQRTGAAIDHLQFESLAARHNIVSWYRYACHFIPKIRSLSGFSIAYWCMAECCVASILGRFLGNARPAIKRQDRQPDRLPLMQLRTEQALAGRDQKAEHQRQERGFDADDESDCARRVGKIRTWRNALHGEPDRKLYHGRHSDEGLALASDIAADRHADDRADEQGGAELGRPGDAPNQSV